MGKYYKIIIFSLFSLLLFVESALALTFTGFTDKFSYKINETINYTGVADQNLTSNITVYLINASNTQFNFTSTVPNSTNFTIQFSASVPRSGEYFVKANFTFNNTYFESSSIVKISKAHSIVIATNKPAYSPGETINFTVRATDLNNIGVSDENLTVRLMHSTNGTVLSSKSSLTNSAGEYSSTFTAPSATGTYRLTVNDWVATKLIDISTFDLVAFTGDMDGNIKTKFGVNDTVYIYMDLFDTNKTRYTGTEPIEVRVTYPHGIENGSVSHTFSGSRLNMTFAANESGTFNIKVTVASTAKSVILPVEVGKYEIVGWLERNSTAATVFFPNERVNVLVKVFNVSTGEVIKTTGLDEVFELNLLDSSFVNSSTLDNGTTVDTKGIRTFNFTTPNTTGLYYVRVRLNQSKIDLDMKVINTIATTSAADQSYNFKSVFVGNKQTIRILTTLSNATHQINVTSISVVSLKTSTGTDITSSVTFNTSIVDYKDSKAGLVEFSSPSAAGLYFIKTLVNRNFAGETQFLIKLYTACAQLDGYRWFISSTDDANLTVRVTEAKDISVVDSLAGNSSDSTNTETGNFSSIYGMHDCYAEYKNTASGSSTSGNNTDNIVVTVKKIVNTLTGEDATTKVANLPSNNTDNNGRVALRLQKPSGGWDGGNYVVELELRDKNNNTDKGFGSFQVKSMWINVWPMQVSGRWRWYFSPTENMSFNVNAYNSTATWYYYGQGSGTGDNCTVMGVFYQGNGAEWFWPPKTIPTSKYTWSCTNSSAPAKGSFNLTINHTAAFDSGYYMVRVKVNTTSGVGDSGEGWFSIKAYNVYARTTSNNYYDSWYRGVTDDVTLDIDVTYANSTEWGCYWQKCSASELVKENLNISAKLIKYDGNPKDYPTSKYNASFANNTAVVTTTSSLTTFLNGSLVNVGVNTSKNVTYLMTTFSSGYIASNANISNITLSSAGWNASATISILKSSTINSATVAVTPYTSNLKINMSLNDTSSFLNTTNNGTGGSYSSNATFTNNLRTLLSTCTADSAGNCTAAFNVTLNSSGTVQLDTLQIYYNQIRNTTPSSNSSIMITIPKNATINSAFVGINMTSGNVTANLSLSDVATLTNLGNSSFFNTSNLSTTPNNVSFGSSLTTALSLCTNSGGNCTLALNITLNETTTATLSNLRINYNTTQTTQNTSAWFINTTSGNANLTFVPRGGVNNNSWETGYYSAAITVDGPQGRETGTYWFEIRSFFANLQPVKPTDFRQTTYSYGSNQNITINVSATNKPSWLGSSSYGVSLTNIPANITAMKLSYWDQSTYQMVQVPVRWEPNASTVTNPTINRTTTVNITAGSTLTAGNWYNLEVTLTDSSGNNQTGWTSFQIKDFTFSARTKNWQYAFNNTENIHLDVAVCDGETWYCNFGSNSYSGSAVTVTATKLMKSDSWPYTEVSGWTTNTSTLNSTNSGQGIVTITPTSTLSGGYYSAELRATPSSGSTITTNVWFKIESFRLSVNTLKWEHKMSENVTLKITTSAAATLSDAYISCGYWPDQTIYSKSGGTLSANSTSLNTGDNLIMLSPSGRNWVSGSCSGSVSVTSGGEIQTAWISFDMKAFALQVNQPKYIYLKNESVVLKVSSDTGQYFNITNVTLEVYNYGNGSYIPLRLGQHFASNATGLSFKGNATINLNASAYGNWSFKEYHNGRLTVVDSNNSAISQTAVFYFYIRDVLYVNAWPVINDTTTWSSPNSSTETIAMNVYTYKYNSAKQEWWSYDITPNINVTVTSIEKESCATWPCTYSNVTGWTASTATSKSDGRAQLNITRNGGWASGWHYLNLRLEESSSGLVEFNRQTGFWVNA